MVNSEHLLWVEKYRPQTVTDCILPDRLKTPFREYVNQKNIPSLMLAGGAGVGKTTIAKAMCNEIGCDYLMINGSDESGIDTFRTKIKHYASSLSLDGQRKVIIIDEADYLNPSSTQPALRNAMEEFSKNCSFIFTCNFKNRIIEPLHSRCAVIDFTLRGKEKSSIAAQFFKRVKMILDSEGIVYDDKVVAEFVQKHFPDFRRVLNELQRYSKFGKLDLELLTHVSQNVKIDDIVQYMKKKDFDSIRKWVATYEADPNVVFREIFDSLSGIVKPSSVPGVVMLLADYQYKQAFVADPQINLTACLADIMINADFK